MYVTKCLKKFVYENVIECKGFHLASPSPKSNKASPRPPNVCRKVNNVGRTEAAGRFIKRM